MWNRMWNRFLIIIKVRREPTRRTTRRETEGKPAEETNVILDDFCPSKYIEMYKNLWKESYITKRSERIIGNINKNMGRYTYASKITRVPWFVIACIHNLEASQSFSKNMMNGQKLNRVTTWVPRGYGPWNSWEDSCVDAFSIKQLPKVWNLENTLYFLERFNGTGYLKYHKNVNSPYLWSYTNMYKKGKYISDGKWSSSAVSKQMGAVAIMKSLGVNLK